MQKYENLFNIKEYLHFIAVPVLLAVGITIVDSDSSIQLGLASCFFLSICCGYALSRFDYDTPMGQRLAKDKDTNYNIVFPCGFMLIGGWVGYLDLIEPDLTSKYTGLIISVAAVSLFGINAEIVKRNNTRIVSETAVSIHHGAVILIFLSIKVLNYYLFYSVGEWVWVLENPLGFIDELIKDDSYMR